MSGCPAWSAHSQLTVVSPISRGDGSRSRQYILGNSTRSDRGCTTRKPFHSNFPRFSITSGIRGRPDVQDVSRAWRLTLCRAQYRYSPFWISYAITNLYYYPVILSHHSYLELLTPFTSVSLSLHIFLRLLFGSTFRLPRLSPYDLCFSF